ncbi:conserved protein of unknown function (plasmid) [Caballeronia sp. S22]
MPARGGTRLSVALKGPIGLGSRTVCRPKYLSALVQHQIASAQRYALPSGLRGKPTKDEGSEMAALAREHAQTRLTSRPRSGPELFGAEPVCSVVRCVRPCAVQALVCLWGHSLQPGHSANRLCRGRHEVLRLGIAVSLVTFFAAAKKVTAAPHRGSANKPLRKRDPAKAQKPQRKRTTPVNPLPQAPPPEDKPSREQSSAPSSS